MRGGGRIEEDRIEMDRVDMEEVVQGEHEQVVLFRCAGEAERRRRRCTEAIPFYSSLYIGQARRPHCIFSSPFQSVQISQPILTEVPSNLCDHNGPTSEPNRYGWKSKRET